jgi:hypothetical protein
MEKKEDAPCAMKRMYQTEINVVLKFNETQRWQEKFWNITRLHINPETAHQTIISCTKITVFKTFIKISLPITMLVQKPSGKNGASVRTGEKVLKQKYYLNKIIQM